MILPLKQRLERGARNGPKLIHEELTGADCRLLLALLRTSEELAREAEVADLMMLECHKAEAASIKAKVAAAKAVIAAMKVTP